MTKRRYPQFFDQDPSLSMVIHADNLENKRLAPRTKKVKTTFISCEECQMFAPTPDGKFGCKKTGNCIN